MDKNTYPPVAHGLPPSAERTLADEKHDPDFGFHRNDEGQGVTHESHPLMEANMEDPDIAEPVMQSSSRILERAIDAIMNNGGQEVQMTTHGADPLPREPRSLQPHRVRELMSPLARPVPPNFRQEEEQPQRSIWNRDDDACARWLQTWGPRRPAPQVRLNMAATTPNSSNYVPGRNRTASRADNSHRFSSTGAIITEMPDPDEPSMTDPYSQPLPGGSIGGGYQPWFQPASHGRHGQRPRSHMYQEGPDRSRNGYAPATTANGHVNPYASTQGPALEQALPASVPGTPSLAPSDAPQSDPNEEANRNRDRIWRLFNSSQPKKPKDRAPAPATFAPRPPLTLLVRFLVDRGLTHLILPRRHEDVEAYIAREEHFTRASFDEFAARDAVAYYEEWKKMRKSDKRSGYYDKKKMRDEQGKKKQGKSMTQSKKRKRNLSESAEDEDVEDAETNVDVEDTQKVDEKRRRQGRGGGRRRRDYGDDEEEEL